MAADQPKVAIEQFDVQSADRPVFGFAEGWHEPEYNPTLGRKWRWMTDRGVLRVRGAGRPLVLRLAGELPARMPLLSRRAYVKISAGGREVLSDSVSSPFEVRVQIPAELVSSPDAAITIETDRVVVPADGMRRSPDRRRLGLQIFEYELRPAS